jgi:hypothetical protein
VPEDSARAGDAVSSDTEEDGSDTTSSDATVADAAIADASISDASLDMAPPTDAEGGCACTHVDSGIPQFPLNGVLPMSCYCDMPWPGFGSSAIPCMSYEESIACDGRFVKRAAVITYTNCNLVTIGYYGGLSVDERHYDVVTHEFVGARRGVYHDVPCGTQQVFAIQAGVLPSSDCQMAAIEFPCVDAGAGDAREP